MRRELVPFGSAHARRFVDAVTTAERTRKPWLVVDADRTLSEMDASRALASRIGINDRVCATFRELGYVDRAFLEVSRIFGAVDAHEYEDAAAAVAVTVTIRHEWERVICELADTANIVVITAGSPAVWRRILLRHGHERVHLIGGCHPALDAQFVSATSKAELVCYLRERQRFVAAAGDSLIDAPMLRAADQALIVPDAKGSPALCAALQDATHVAHFSVGGEPALPLPTFSPNALIDLFTSISKGHDHAHRPIHRTPHATCRWPNPPLGMRRIRPLQRAS